MKILHYALGFPPYRTGGLTKFCIDLMRQQNKDGHQTALMWPGRMKLWDQRVSVKERHITLISEHPCEIISFEVVNPLPVPYDEGISEFHFFEKNVGKDVYEKLLRHFQPDVIHIHTLMGLHRSFLESARERKIRCVFTTHDYFPICPKVTLFHNGQVCSTALECSDCGNCNTTALSIGKIWMLQSRPYRFFKDCAIVRSMRKRHRDAYLYNHTEDKTSAAVGAESDYKGLRNYYESFLKLMDVIHYNSTIAKSVYEQYFSLPNSTVIGISHGDIADRKKHKKFSRQELRITYLGPQGEAKGFYLLKEALDRLWKTGRRFCLNIYFAPAELSPYMRPHNPYTYPELEHIFDNTDLIVVPGIWQETFGYVVLEALSYGVPVLLSNHIGACDIVEPGAGIILEDITADKLYHVLSSITENQLSDMNEIIWKRQKIPTIRDVAELLEETCYYEGKIEDSKEEVS